MNDILDSDLIASIRTLLGVDAETIPDSTILDPMIGGAAERQVMTWVGSPDYELRPADEQERIRAAVAYLTASALLDTGAMRDSMSVTTEKYSDQYSVTRQKQSIQTWQRGFRADAGRVLEPLLPRRDGVQFRLAAGRRGA